MRKAYSLFAILIGLFVALQFSSCRDWEAVHEVLKEHAIADAEYVGSETCALCHEDVVRDFPLSTHYRVAIPMEGSEVEGCEMCHGPGSKHVEVEGQDGQFIINPNDNPEACYACHTEKRAEFRLPFTHPVAQGKMSCTDCHDPHGPEVRPGAMTALSAVNETCTKCHKEQNGPFVWRHEAVEEGCTNCHNVHGSVNDKMLVARNAQLCLRCHAADIYPAVGDSNHSGRLPSGTCFSASCHNAVHGSNFDEHLRY